MVDILLVEDHLELAALMSAFLQKEGFSLCHMTDAETALDWLKEYKAKIVLLDIMLPGMDGFALCQALRHQYTIPIIIVSARSTKVDQLLGFELGADDYLEKPIDPDILCAKVKALLMRTYGEKDRIHSGELMIDTRARKVYLKEHLIELNGKEYDLLCCFVKNPNKTLHKEYLFSQIWGAESESEFQTLTVHVKRLRKKIEKDPRHPMRIQTVWGIGYRYEEI